MNTPTPYEPKDRVVVNGKQYVVTDRAPHGDDWRYTGTPTDLAGPELHFDHAEALPVRSTTRAPSMRGVLAAAGLDVEEFDAQEAAAMRADEMEHPGSPLEELLAVVRRLAHRGDAPPELHAAWVSYAEAH